MTTALDVIKFADSFAGYVEGPGNNETLFGKWAGADRQAWCHSFVSYCLDHEGVGIGKITYCPTGVVYFRNRFQLYTTPQVGDVFYQWFPSKNRYAHTGFVKAFDDEWITTREGNSNAAGSRTGGAVVSLRRRYAGTRTVFGRPLYTMPTKPIPQPDTNYDEEVLLAWS